MAVSYGFFNSVGGDRKYNADDLTNYFVKLISDGVFATPATCMQVSANGGMSVKVAEGWAFVQCRWLHNSADYALTVETADIVNPRIDRVVVRCDYTRRLIEIAVKKGTPAASPTAPELTRTAGEVYELSLAQILIPANSVSVSNANITDERQNADLCGIVAGLIDQIDATNIFQQFTAAFQQWFSAIKDEVRTTTIIVPYEEIIGGLPGQSVFQIPQPYNDSLDILEVYQNGFRLMEGLEYTHDSRYVRLTSPLTTYAPIDIRVLKAMDTTAAESIVSAFAALVQRVTEVETKQGGLTLRKLSQAEYDAIEQKDADTVYYAVDGDKVRQYLGEVELTGGSSVSIGNPVGQLGGVIGGAIGAAEEV